ncbi:hypothetical protein MKW94_025721 [Papaver nudicaule]|uniref:Micro-fibrillar-associated protein 1 C-terminal domain-containing protein n=1 Tax=Papaver nudicaule TaxID=74823 RepID=A0AA41RTW1_PAPNU|nr:hypothetical protein [Papaver nudicaule]
MSVTAGVRDTVITIRDKLRGKIGQTKVKRYWPGKAPEWADEAEEEGDIRTAREVALETAFPTRDDSDVVRKDDPRLRRLAESKIDNREDREEIRADHRRIRQAEIVSTIEEENRRQEGLDLEEEDEEAMEERRRKIKAKLLQREQEEASLLPEEEEDEPVESEEESEYETDSEEELTGIAMVKPVFVPKAERDTIAERERLEAEEQALEVRVRKRQEERKKETKQIVVEEIQKSEQIQKNLEAEANIEDVDTDDELNEAEEYEAWKVREIARIKRDREDRDAMVKEKEEIEKLRNMTEEERREWERKNPKITDATTGKQKWRFMQKYYHKGAFFQDDADDPAGTARADKIYTRDFSKPTGEDNMDKTILPKVMQVKHFGRSGRTKWTHLVNEDTTVWDNPWANNDTLRAKYNSKMAGMDAPIAKPRGSKKLKDWELTKPLFTGFQQAAGGADYFILGFGMNSKKICSISRIVWLLSSENSFFLMAEEEVVANSALLQSPPQNPPPFLEVICKSSGEVRRFAIGTESKFALYLINLKLESGVSHASYIEAVKEGEEPINFGPNALLTDYGHGWKLRTVSEQEVPGKDMGAQPMYKKNPAFMKSDGLTPTGRPTMDTSDSQTNYQYFGRIFIALVLLFLLGCTFTLALENLPRLILFITSTI